MARRSKIPKISKKYRKILKGKGRGKGEGLTLTTGLTKGQGLTTTDPNLTLKPLNKRLVKGKKVFKKIFANKGTKESNMKIDNKKIFSTKDPSGKKELEFPKTKGPYKIEKGDTLSGIAKKFGTSVKKIMEDNPDIKDANKIRAGAGLKGLPMGQMKTKRRRKRRQDNVFGMGVGFNRGGFIKSGDGDKIVKRAYGGKVGK